LEKIAKKLAQNSFLRKKTKFPSIFTKKGVQKSAGNLGNHCTVILVLFLVFFRVLKASALSRTFSFLIFCRQGCKFFKFFPGRSGAWRTENFRPEAERSGKISPCGGNPPQLQSAVAEIRHGGKKFAVAEIRRGGKIAAAEKNSLWRKTAVAEKSLWRLNELNRND